ncbi:V-type ATP synthase subunit D [candidate division KSB1 bacterium]|nr:V-type ATP synthase subunit D [candidate division KSB1 bacterium]
MAKVKLTKNELKRQKDNLQRYTRYLPTLELKKKQLLVEIAKIQHEIEKIEAEMARTDREVSAWVAVFAQDVALDELVALEEIKTSSGNIAGIEIPIFEEVVFADVEIDLFYTPLWVDTAIEVVQKQIEQRSRCEIAKKQQEIIRNELRITIQRIKLFEEVMIPQAKENIRVIQIFLADQQTAEVVRGKIAKAKIEKKKLETVLS